MCNQAAQIAITRYESLKAHDGAIIRVARFEPADVPVGVVQIVHGFGEGLTHYIGVAAFFTKNGYACVIHDQRGFGEMPHLSPKKRRRARGVVPGYKHLLEDVKTLRGKIERWYPNMPVILYGHSMGGNIAANYVLRRNEKPYTKAVLEAPWFRLYKPLSEFNASLAKVLGRISRRFTVASKLNLDDISRDADVIKNLRDDDVYHDRMSLRLYTEVAQAGEYALKNAMQIPVPTLLLCPGADKIVCPAAIREFSECENVHIKLVEFADSYHCLHSDINNAEVMGVVMEFIRE